MEVDLWSKGGCAAIVVCWRRKEGRRKKRVNPGFDAILDKAKQ